MCMCIRLHEFIHFYALFEWMFVMKVQILLWNCTLKYFIHMVEMMNLQYFFLNFVTIKLEHNYWKMQNLLFCLFCCDQPGKEFWVFIVAEWSLWFYCSPVKIWWFLELGKALLLTIEVELPFSPFSSLSPLVSSVFPFSRRWSSSSWPPLHSDGCTLTTMARRHAKHHPWLSLSPRFNPERRANPKP